MVFSSLFFVFAFLPVVLLLYYLCPGRYRNYVALGASCFFYAWGAPRFVFVLVGSSLIDYVISRAMGVPGSCEARKRRRLLAFAVTLNLAVFLYFKYANFFVEEFSRVAERWGGRAVPWADLALPIGISFFTFQKLSYLVDVYRGVVAPARSPSNYVLYVSLFPQLIAGPIVRYHDVVRQLEHRPQTAKRMFTGIWRFCRGLGKKVLIANVLGEVADGAFGVHPDHLCAVHAWVGLLCYSFQIYFDFSGYSDMAIGLGRMLGFEFLENFNCPYIARSFTEFWRRWHISLTNWMKEYFYIPLGGNRRGGARTYVNLWIVFVLSGLWHGASWNFVLWGFYHGLFLSMAKLAGRERLERIPSIVSVPATFFLVMMGWVFFRAETLQHTRMYFGRLFSGAGAGAARMPLSHALDPLAATVLTVAFVISFAPAFRGAYGGFVRFWETRRLAADVLKFAASLLLLVLSASALAAGKFNPFIYFRF